MDKPRNRQSDHLHLEQRQILAKAVKKACLDAAKEGFTEASISGLCMDGAVEAALGAIDSVDIDDIISKKS